MEIPEKYEDVTAEWLTAALREGGVILPVGRLSSACSTRTSNS